VALVGASVWLIGALGGALAWLIGCRAFSWAFGWCHHVAFSEPLLLPLCGLWLAFVDAIEGLLGGPLFCALEGLLVGPIVGAIMWLLVGRCSCHCVVFGWPLLMPLRGF
jgi:hypothetical protein